MAAIISAVIVAVVTSSCSSTVVNVGAVHSCVGVVHSDELSCLYTERNYKVQTSSGLEFREVMIAVCR